jgi:hypothetical protein
MDKMVYAKYRVPTRLETYIIVYCNGLTCIEEAWPALCPGYVFLNINQPLLDLLIIFYRSKESLKVVEELGESLFTFQIPLALLKLFSSLEQKRTADLFDLGEVLPVCYIE